jgi:pyrroloquinoline quinone biosynthesis protein D
MSSLATFRRVRSFRVAYMDNLTPRPLAPHVTPRLRTGVRLMKSEQHGGWVLLAPERMFKMNPVAADIVRQCDGASNFTGIVDRLIAIYQAPRELIEKDVTDLIASLAARQLLDL